jgi:YD repeat-containing protein
VETDESSYDVFLSYHWRDHTSVETVARVLVERGLKIFLDRWYLIPGLPWQNALQASLGHADAVIIFIGPEGLGNWQQREVALALDRQAHASDFPVIPVLLPGADPPLGFLALNTWIDLRSDIADQSRLSVIARAVRREPPIPGDEGQSRQTISSICPYRGLRYFREEDAPFFCGREAFTEKLVEAVNRSSLVAVVGASGCGKSSVVRAGLFPMLRANRRNPVWSIATLVPSDRPLHSLAAALAPILDPSLSEVDQLAEVNKLANHFAEGTVSLCDAVARCLAKQPGTDRLLLFVDQWEELYTLCQNEGARQRFLDEILAATATGNVTVVLTLRGDFFGQALSHRAFADRLQDAQVNLGPMTHTELGRSIIEPAKAVGLVFEPGLDERILNDVGDEPGNLPLLEFVLTELWEKRQGCSLHHDAYEQMGGVQGAIAARAGEVFERMDTVQKAAARRMLVQMVRPGEGTIDTRQRTILPLNDTVALTVIRRLADARLVVTSRDKTLAADTVEVSHEALIRNWTLLRAWVDEDREFLRTKARIEAQAALWEAENHDASRLLPAGHPLKEGKELLMSRRADLRASVIAFIEASLAAATKSNRRKFLVRMAAFATVVFAMGGSILYWYLYLGNYTEYCNAYAKRWGVMEGVGRVSTREVAFRNRSLRFFRKGRLGPVMRVDAVDSSGNCAPGGLFDFTMMSRGQVNDSFFKSPQRPCGMVWERDSDGRITRQTLFDSMGRVLFSLIYTDERKLKAELRTEGGSPLPIGVANTITYQRIENDGPNLGQDQFERFTDALDHPRPSLLTGAFGAKIEYDSRGLQVHAIFLDQNDKPMRNNAGFAEVRLRYDEAGSPIQVSLFDENGKPVRNINGVAGWSIQYDEHGNEINEAYFDEEGKPTRSSSGYAKLGLNYDTRGRESALSYFDEKGKLMWLKDGYARINRKYDTAGNLVETAYFDEANMPVLSKEGYARVTLKFDNFGNPVEEAYFNGEGKPIRSKDGVAGIKTIFDSHGQVTKITYFDELGRPTRNKNGYVNITGRYDKFGNPPIEEAYLDGAEKPTLSKDGYAKVTRIYDVAGHLIEEAYFDGKGKPTLSKDGYAQVVKTYDEHGNQIKAVYFGEEGKPIASKYGDASVALAYDTQGHMIKRSHYDENGKPTRVKDNYATLTRKYDSNGNVVEEAYFDEEGHPTVYKEGYAKILQAFDSRGNVVKKAYFDTESKPITSKDGYTSQTAMYDAQGNAIRQDYFDEEGKPTCSKDNIAGFSRIYDKRGNVIEEAYFDEKGHPTVIKDGYAKLTQAFDARGNEIEESYFDIDSKPVRSKNGYARLTQAYNERDNVIEQAFFDEAGSPIRSNEGYARLTRTLDDRNNTIEEAYFDETGKPTRNKDSYAKVRFIYDERSNQIEGAYYDEGGKPTINKDLGVFRWRAVFDSRGNSISASGFDANGKPSPGNEGFCTIKRAYDGRDNRIEQRYFDEQEKPMRIKDGYARVTWTHDARGNKLEETYFDEKDNRIRSKNGYSKVIKAYDHHGDEIQEAYFDEKNKPVRSKDGYAKVVKIYDTRGNKLNEIYFDEKGRRVRSSPRLSASSTAVSTNVSKR